MWHVEFWATLGIISGAIVAFLGALGLIWRMLGRPVIGTWRKVGKMADDFLGDKRQNIPSLPDQVAGLRSALNELSTEHAEHMAQWHTPRTPNGARAVAPTPRRTGR